MNSIAMEAYNLKIHLFLEIVTLHFLVRHVSFFRYPLHCLFIPSFVTLKGQKDIFLFTNFRRNQKKKVIINTIIYHPKYIFIFIKIRRNIFLLILFIKQFIDSELDLVSNKRKKIDISEVLILDISCLVHMQIHSCKFKSVFLIKLYL